MMDMSLPLPEDDDDDVVGMNSAEINETTPSGQEPYNWITIEKTLGIMPAQIIADSLKSEGIPARAIQEGGGAFGLTVGLLGEGRVLVPDIHEIEARKILDQIAKEFADFAESDEFDE